MHRLPHRLNRTSALLGLAAVLALLVAAAPAAAADLWFHVTVDEADGDNSRVTVNLPVSLIESVMPIVAQHAGDHQYNEGRVRIDDSDVSVAELRQILASLRDAPDATYAEIESDSERVVVYKRGGYLEAETTESGAGGSNVRARIPLTVLDALLSGNGEELDLAAAIRALAAHGEGELVTVHDGDSHIRVWIDAHPQAD